MDKISPEFIKNMKKDSDMPELSLHEQNELWNQILNKNKRHDSRFKRLLLWSGSVAASISIILAVNGYMSSGTQPETVNYQMAMQSFKPARNISDNVLLVLSDHRKIQIKGEEAQLDYEEEGWVSINKNDKIEVSEEKSDEKVVFNQIVVPVGKHSLLTFEDGTRIWINSGSRLVYPVKFEEHKREVFIDGEIFLDVNSNPDRPFIVHTSAFNVKVLGTQFNVSAYSDQPDLQVVLVDGEVEIHQEGVPKETLKPNQMFSYNEELLDGFISTVDVTDYVAWKDRYYSFHRQELGLVLAKLSKYYNVQFEWEENKKLKELSCSGKLDLKNDIKEVLKALENTAPIEIRKVSEREYSVIDKP